MNLPRQKQLVPVSGAVEETDITVPDNLNIVPGASAYKADNNVVDSRVHVEHPSTVHTKYHNRGEVLRIQGVCKLYVAQGK